MGYWLMPQASFLYFLLVASKFVVFTSSIGFGLPTDIGVLTIEFCQSSCSGMVSVSRLGCSIYQMKSLLQTYLASSLPSREQIIDRSVAKETDPQLQAYQMFYWNFWAARTRKFSFFKSYWQAVSQASFSVRWGTLSSWTDLRNYYNFWLFRGPYGNLKPDFFSLSTIFFFSSSDYWFGRNLTEGNVGRWLFGEADCRLLSVD